MQETTNSIDAADERLAVSINDLNLTAKAHAALRNARITTVGAILEVQQGKGLLRVRNLGKAQYDDIVSVLGEMGLFLDGGAPSPAEVVTETPDPAAQRDPPTPMPPPPAEQPAPPPTPIMIEPPLASAQAGPPLPKTVVFVDYEHWFVALRELHKRRPNIRAWFEDLKTRGRLLEVTFFGNFSDTGGMKDEIANIRMFSNRIIETKNPSEHSKKDFTDFIMLDSIYQKVITMPDIEQVVLFTGDGHFASVASYLRNFCSKVVGIYGVDQAISGQLEAISDWCVRIPFVNEPYRECRAAILKNLKHAEDHTKSPTFTQTVRLVAEHYELHDDAVEAELKRMISEGVVYTVSERSRWDYKVMLNILKVNWELASQQEL